MAWYFAELAAALVRGATGFVGSTDAALAHGLAVGLDLHRFKRSAELPRVRAVLGVLAGLAPERLLDVGSGRGVFLWPVLDRFATLDVTAVDLEPHHLVALERVRRGGVGRLRPVQADTVALPFADGAFDVVTVLEVLEHLTEPARAAAEVLRVSCGWVVVSVPSDADDNPGHLHLFDGNGVERLFAGAESVRLHRVRGHIVALVRP